MGGHIGTGQGLVWMTNGENGMLLGLEVLRGMADLLGWTDFQPLDKAVAQIDPAVLEEYQGNYQYADYPEFGAIVTKEDGLLFLQETPIGLRYELYPESETTFFALERFEAITFVRDADGGVEAVMIGNHERLNRTGSGF
jgi:hypothetical protein